jgi:hypothetical protein
LQAIRERNAAAWQAIQKRYKAVIRQFLDKRGIRRLGKRKRRAAAIRPLKPGSKEYRRFTEVERLRHEEMAAAERLHHEEMAAWRGKYGAREPEVASPLEMRVWIEQQRMVAEAAVAAYGAGAAALDEDLAGLYEKAHDRAVQFRVFDPALPPLPERTARSALDLQRLCDWCTPSPSGRPDMRDYVPASQAQREMEFPTYKRLTCWLTQHPDIRTCKPSKNRLLVHAGDLLASKAKTDEGEFEAASAPAEAVADEYAKRIEQRKARVRKARPSRAP